MLSNKTIVLLCIVVLLVTAVCSERNDTDTDSFNPLVTMAEFGTVYKHEVNVSMEYVYQFMHSPGVSYHSLINLFKDTFFLNLC